VSGSQIEQLVDELILFADISVADPPRLPLPDHVQRLVSLDRSPGHRGMIQRQDSQKLCDVLFVFPCDPAHLAQQLRLLEGDHQFRCARPSWHDQP
jgi:hypothetical protein